MFFLHRIFYFKFLLIIYKNKIDLLHLLSLNIDNYKSMFFLLLITKEIAILLPLNRTELKHIIMIMYFKRLDLKIHI